MPSSVSLSISRSFSLREANQLLAQIAAAEHADEGFRGRVQTLGHAFVEDDLALRDQFDKLLHRAIPEVHSVGADETLQAGAGDDRLRQIVDRRRDRKSTRLNSSH